MQLDEQRLRFRGCHVQPVGCGATSLLPRATPGRCGITATAVCSVTDTPPSVSGASTPTAR